MHRTEPDMAGLDIALIGVPFDLGVVHRAGARFGPQAIRDITSKVGPYNHYNRINPFALCEIADIGDVPLGGFSLDNGIAQIEAFYRQVHLGRRQARLGRRRSLRYLSNPQGHRAGGTLRASARGCSLRHDGRDRGQ